MVFRLSFAVAIFVFCSALISLAEKNPNIILVMADDQGWGDTGYNNHPFVQTPHMDAMAKSGVVFDRFYAGAPVCSPTRASVMTGRMPVRTNVPNHGHYMRPQEVTLAEALKANGYRTAHFGKWHIGSVQKESPTSPGGCGFDEWLTGLNFFDNDPYLSHNGTFKQLKGQGSVVAMDAALKFIRQHAKEDKPLFTVIWFPAPHLPHKEISSQAKLYADKKHKGYFQEITLIDEQLGRLRKELRDLEIDQNTILWYCSDNGGLVLKSSGGRGKKGSIYEGGLRVPSIVEWPAKWKPSRVSVPASTSDIYPTLLRSTKTRVSNQPQLDGIDLTNIIGGKVNRRSNTIGFWHNYTSGQVTHSDRIIKELMVAQQAGEKTPYPERLLKNVKQFPAAKELKNKPMQGHAALIDWPYKIHAIAVPKKKNIRYELYHLANDPMETKDLSKSEKVVFAKLKRAMGIWQKSVLDSLQGKDYK